MNIPFRITPSSITLVLAGVTHILTHESHVNYNKVREALKVKDYEALSGLIDLPKIVEQFGQGKIKIVNGSVYFADIQIQNTLTKRILEQMAEGFDISPMALFLENLMLNPSKRAVDELYDFLEACDLPVTDDGHFVAYKKVRSDYFDIHSGTMNNSIGNILTMPRNMVDEDKSRTCSSGLHFCSQAYLPQFGSSPDNRVVIVKINPRDVVAIPSDYGNAKGRTCQYEVIGEVDPSQLTFYKSSVYDTSTDDCGDSQSNNHDDADEFVEVCDDYLSDTEPAVVHPKPTNESMVAKATRYGLVKSGMVPVKNVGGIINVYPHKSAPVDAIMRSYETKSVRRAVKAAIEILENGAPTPVDLVFDLIEMSEEGWETPICKVSGLGAAIIRADELAIDTTGTKYSVVVCDGDDNTVYTAYNEEYNETSSSSSSEEEESSDDEEDDVPEQVLVPATKPQGVLFTKSQAAAILGVNLERLQAMLEVGDRVEIDGDLVRIKS